MIRGLEEDVAVFCHTACNGCVGIEGAFAEFGDGLAVNQRFEVFLLYHFDFLDFMRCAEAVEEVDERNA